MIDAKLKDHNVLSETLQIFLNKIKEQDNRINDLEKMVILLMNKQYNEQNKKIIDLENKINALIYKDIRTK